MPRTHRCIALIQIALLEAYCHPSPTDDYDLADEGPTAETKLDQQFDVDEEMDDVTLAHLPQQTAATSTKETSTESPQEVFP